MNEEHPVHLIGKIAWLPQHNVNKSRQLPDTIFRALGIFTSDYSIAQTVLISYSPAEVEQGLHEVRISIPFRQIADIKTISQNSELLVMDGYRVIAVCRHLKVLPATNTKMGDPWN